MTERSTFASLEDLRTRYPRELVTLAADEETGLLDEVRVEAVLGDVTVEIRAILLARYSRRELDTLDDDARDVLRVFAMAMALYRVALSFARSSERLREGYDVSLKTLQGIAAGKGALGIAGEGGSDLPAPGTAGADNGNVLVESAERVFSRDRLRGL